MKTLLALIALSLFFSTPSNAQEFSKKYPVKNKSMLFHPNAIVFSQNLVTNKSAKEQVVSSHQLSEEQYVMAIALTNIKYYPPAINSISKLNGDNRMADYHCFIVARFNEYFPEDKFFRQLMLVWIPAEDNKHMPADYQPITPEGFFVLCIVNDNYKLPPLVTSQSMIDSLTDKLQSAGLQTDDVVIDYNNFNTTGGLNMGEFYAALQKLGLTEHEMAVVADYAVYNNFPDSLAVNIPAASTVAKLKKYKYYFMGEFPERYGPLALYWVPANQNFEPGFKPKSKLGFFFTAMAAKEPQVQAPDQYNNLYYNTAKYINDFGEKNYTYAKHEMLSPYYYYSPRFLNYTRDKRDLFLYKSKNMYYVGNTPKFEQKVESSSQSSSESSRTTIRENNTYYIYAELQKTALVTNSANTSYQLKYAVVFGPPGLSEAQILSAIDRRRFRAFGMEVVGTDWVECGKTICYEKLPFQSYKSGVSKSEVGKYTYRGN